MKATRISFLLLAAAAMSFSATKASDVLAITVKDQVHHHLDPRLFGQFMERPAFSGEIGPEAAVVPGTHQLQPQAEKLIREMQIPALRFPGGTDVDFLDWTDMVDNVPGRETKGRPTSAPRGKKVTNAFGYDEFLQMCGRNRSEAILALNFRDGLLGVKPLEEAAAHAAALVSYCNGSTKSLPPSLAKWAQLRVQNGHPEPYHVKYFQIGNETWMFNPEVKKKVSFTGNPLKLDLPARSIVFAEYSISKQKQE
jgi:alpha-N-arabinofuranosidase